MVSSLFEFKFCRKESGGVTNSKRFTQKLILIILSLVVCVVSLVAVTFGLFTSEDSNFIRVSSAEVKIDLLMANENGDYVSIRNGNGELFGDSLWEPGQTRIAFLKIQSESNIRVKYSMRLDAMNDEMLGAFEYITYAGDSIDADISSYAQLKNKYGSELLLNGVNLISGESYVYLEPDEAHYYVIALHMLPECTNDYQGKSFMLDLNVLAVQGNYTNETESTSEEITESTTEAFGETESVSD